MTLKQDLNGRRFGKLIATNKMRCRHHVSTRLCYCDGEAARNRLLEDYQHSAEKRGLAWNLTSDQFNILIKGLCFFCQSPPSSIKRPKGKNTQACRSGVCIYNGIDRINSKFGYSPKNTVSCCTICNRAKRDMAIDDFMNWIKRLRKL